MAFDDFKGVVVGSLATVLLVSAVASNTIIGAGERGVRVTWGNVSPEPLTEGVHFKIPFVQQIVKYDIKTQKSSIKTNVYTKDIQQADIAYVLNYNLKPDYAPKMYKTVGKDYQNTVLMPIVEGVLKDVIGKWIANDLISNREEATHNVLVNLKNELKDRGIEVTSFNMTTIQYAPEFEKAVEDKVKAQQKALEAKNKTVQVEEEAKQKLLSAEAEAKSMRIRANALTQNKALVQYEAVKKWDGKLPTYMLGNSVPFVNMKAGE